LDIEAIKQYKNLPKLIKEQVKDVLISLSDEPSNCENVIPLKYIPGYRYKKGDF